MIDIIEEPAGEIYDALLNFVASKCKLFSLVWRHQFKFEKSADEIAIALRPFLISEAQTSKWPGTKLLGHKATLRYYQITSESTAELRRAGRLYAWMQPHVPEDLVFYLSVDEPWLVSVSHENIAWFEDASLTLSEIQNKIPGIRIEQQDES